jgi:hypothetical protein
VSESERSREGGHDAGTQPVDAERADTPTETQPRDTDAGNSEEAEARSGRRRARRGGRKPFPSLPFEEALTLGQAIQRIAPGQRIRRLTLFEELGRAPESGPSRQLVTSANQYGIISGGAQAEWLELTPDGARAVSDEADVVSQLRARFSLAIQSVDWFNRLYEQFKGNRLPAPSVFGDYLEEQGLDPSLRNECIETFVVNAKYLGLVRALSGVERLLTVEHAADDLERTLGASAVQPMPARVEGMTAPYQEVAASRSSEGATLNDVCFFVAPIGPDNAESRHHSDLVMNSLVDPALREFQLRLVRADAISEPGIINAQVIEHIVHCPLVIADLSFHNPNVFYELALRHAVAKPIVQLIRTADPIPFDLQQFRTIKIDTTNIYTLVPQLETYKVEIASQIRTALDRSSQAQNPLSLFYPRFWSELAGVG